MVSVEDSINQRLLLALQQHGQRPALFEHGEVYTYDWLNGAVASAALKLCQLGVVKGDRIAYQLRNTREAVVIMLSSLMLGAIPVPILPSYREKELRHILHLTAPKVFALQRGSRRYNPLAALQTLLAEGLNIDVILVEDYDDAGYDTRYLNLQHFCSPLTPAPPLHAATMTPSDTAVMLLSSGTTGLPKAIARKMAATAI